MSASLRCVWGGRDRRWWSCRLPGPTSGSFILAVHGRPVEYFDVHDPTVHDVQAQHASRGRERYAPMAGAVRLSLRMNCGPEALAEVITAAALVDQTKAPRTDGQLTFSFALQESDQLRDEIREDVADKGAVLLHDRRVAGDDMTSSSPFVVLDAERRACFHVFE